jgi:AraC family transcriptional regulator
MTEGQNPGLWSSRGQILPAGALCRRVSSSPDCSVGELVLEQHYFPNVELSDVMFRRHAVVITLSEYPIACEYKKQGRFRSFLKTRGSISIFPSHRPFSLRLDIGPQKAGRSILLGLDPIFMNEVATEANLNPDHLELVEQRRETDPALLHVARALQNGIRTGDSWDPLYREALSRALTVHLLREYCSVKPEINCREAGLPPDKLKRALGYIQDRLDTELSVAGIAHAVSISPYHFMRLFKKSTGKSPHQYVIEERVRKAKDLLATGKMSVCEAAYRVGFVDQSHLTRHFKRVFGLPPKALLLGHQGKSL